MNGEDGSLILQLVAESYTPRSVGGFRWEGARKMGIMVHQWDGMDGPNRGLIMAGSFLL